MDFTSNISPKVSISSNTSLDISATIKRQERNPKGTTIILLVDILGVKPTWCLRTETKRQVALLDYLYTFANKERVYLYQLILNNYKEISFRTSTYKYYLNCDLLL